MSNYRIKIQYDGSRYRGWQRQQGEKNTIQGRIEQVLSKQMEFPVTIDGAGRTDAGVHAKEQVANFRLNTEKTTQQLQDVLNEYLPEDIRILKVEEAGERFHSRLNATGKVYEYCLCKKDGFDVFGRKYMWQMDKELDVMRMRQAAEKLVGEHDFKGFCTKASRKKSTERNLYDITITEDENRIYLTFYGSGFLYNMVRIMVGTILEIAAGSKPQGCIPQILEQRDRAAAGFTAPAWGLYLDRVFYEQLPDDRMEG